VSKLPKILIVEDETIVAMDIERGLRALGYVVVGAAGQGESAIELAQAERPDLILMDIRLKGPMDGIEAACEIRSRFSIPVIFLTAHADEATVERAKAAEPYGYLLKPFVDQELHTAIEIALNKRRAEQAVLTEAGRALQQSEERFRLLVESLKDYAVFLLDIGGRVLTWNPGAERLKGFKEPEIVGRHFSKFFTAEEIVRNYPDQLLASAAENGQARHEGWRIRKDGARFWAEVLITALRDSQGQLVGFADICRDVTEQKRAEEQIQKLNSSLETKVRERTAELDAANRELEAFTYSVAHDLRGPLRGLRGMLDILQGETRDRLPSEALDYLGRGTSCADRMGRLIDDLLNLSKVGRSGLRWTEVDLNRLVAEVIADLENETKGRRISWQIDPLPSVQGDPGLLKQVYANLISNAVKYSAHADPARICASHRDDHGQLVLLVSDNGVGFDMKYSAKLFEPFTRLHEGQGFAGNGVGLAIVERIVRKHGGKVWAEGRPGEGAAFFFTLNPASHSSLSHQEGLAALEMKL
jgi:PAS domain S-box-containing protein